MKRDEKTCPFCKQSWEPRVENPIQCPRCKRVLPRAEERFEPKDTVPRSPEMKAKMERPVQEPSYIPVDELGHEVLKGG